MPCAAQKTVEAFKDATTEFPSDFDGKTIVVVTEGSQKSVNKWLEKDLEKYYTGEYRLVEEGDHLSPKDTAKARYFIIISPSFQAGHFVTDGSKASGLGREGPETDYQIMMVDKKTNLMYTTKNASSCYACLLKDYFKHLEKLRTGT